MRLYFAPLEGITGYVFRRAHHKYFGGVEKYFTPFISPTQNKWFTNKERNDILPENNEGIYTVPQILTNSAQYFIETAKELKAYGYREINLNLGCPSGTVVSKHKGAGFLERPKELALFLEKIFELSHMDMEISIKTRIGKERPEEFFGLLDIFNRFPIKELIIHPRCQADMYQGVPDKEMFRYAYENSKNPLCYNGDILTWTDARQIFEEFEKLGCVMIGRGLLRNPALSCRFMEAEGTQPEGNGILGADGDRERFWSFHNELLNGYMEIMSGDKNTLFKMKELWFYMIQCFPGKEKAYKKIKKAQSVREYKIAVGELSG